jgi:hypothetical protein
MSIYDWSTTAASNATVGSISWAEGQAPSTVNDSARAEMADVAAWRDLLGGAKVSTGTDTIALTSGLSLSAYAQGMMFAFEAGGTNTGAVTLNVDAVGAKAIKKYHDVALAAGDIEAGGIYLVAYEASNDEFQLLSPVSVAPLISSDIGVTVQGYDADTAKTDVSQAFTAPQYSAFQSVTDGTLAINTYTNFTYTPSGADVLEFSGEANGLNGLIVVVNPSAYAITLGSEIDGASDLATTISAAGTYLLGYACYDGTNVWVTYAGTNGL